MHRPRPTISQQRFTRLIAWALGILVWIATALDHGTPADQRRIRQRDWFFDPDNAARIVRDLIVLRAIKLARLRALPRRPTHGATTRNIHLRRAAAGSRLRHAINHRDPIKRLKRLIHALRNIDQFAAALVRRLKRRLTRLYPRLTTPQAADAVSVLARTSPVAADSS
jgi:hypothetical protein